MRYDTTEVQAKDVQPGWKVTDYGTSSGWVVAFDMPGARVFKTEIREDKNDVSIWFVEEGDRTSSAQFALDDIVMVATDNGILPVRMWMATWGAIVSVVVGINDFVQSSAWIAVSLLPKWLRSRF